MRRKYQTLDTYLDDLDAIKAKVAEKTRGMSTEQVLAYFAASRQRLQALTGKKLRTRPRKRKPVTAKA